MNLTPPPDTDDVRKLKQWCDELYEFLKKPVFPGGVNVGDTTNYAEISNTGNVTFVGTSGLVFGHMYTNTTIAVTLTTQNTWYEVDAAQAWTTGLLNNVTFTDPGLIVLEPGIYEAIYTASTDFSAPPGAAQIIEYGIMIDGAIQNEGQSRRTLANSTDTGHCSGVGIFDLADNAVVSLGMRNITSGGKILHMERGNLIVRQIGGT